MRQRNWRMSLDCKEKTNKMAEKKVALVTGCDHGVGLSLVEELLNRGYSVIACRFDETERHLDELKKDNDSNLHILPLNIGSDASVAAMKEEAAAVTDKIDLLINCAGILGDITATVEDELDFEEMLRVINVNSLGTLRVTNALISLVENSDDKTIVNISSEAGSIGDCWRDAWFGYCMSKAANNMQGAIVHNLLKKKGGRVIQMHPGHVATWMRGHLDTTAKITPEESARGILATVLDGELPESEHPLYIDYTGSPLIY